MTLYTEIVTLIKKDILLEWRQKHAISSLLLYTVGAVFICYLGFVQNLNLLNSVAWNSTFWIVILFVAIQTASKSFQQESSARDYYYYYLVSPTSIISSKLIYNLVLMSLIGGVTILLFQFFLLPDASSGLTTVVVKNWKIFYLNIWVGCMLFGASLTLISAISAKAGASGSLMAILGFPVVLPMLALLVRNSLNAIKDINPNEIVMDFSIMSILLVLIITVSLALFPYLWRS